MVVARLPLAHMLPLLTSLRVSIWFSSRVADLDEHNLNQNLMRISHLVQDEHNISKWMRTYLMRTYLDEVYEVK